ncbi:MAG: hypothetical protein JXB60_09820, partial [Candidatus Cloacimonetes bacterium]|nr:hypothetical protein [Candidatus Cloacimonadota bacterium]
MVFFLAIIVVILIFLFYRRTVPPLYNWQKYTLILLRSITTVILVLLLLNPILYFIRNKLTRPQFIILKDNSASMVNSEINKYDLLAASYDLLSRSLKKSKYEIQEYDFADGLNGNPERTYLSKTLHEIINRYDLRDLKGILLLSDGWFKDEELSIFNEYFIPLYTYLPDYRSMDFDLELTNLHYNKKAYRQEMTPIIADIRSQNYQGKAVVEFLLQGKIEHSQRIDFQSDPYQQITLEHEFRETGLQEFTIRIMADSTGEHNMDNNLFPAAVQVVNNRSRVIILSDRLNWDIKFMIDALRSQPRWEINFILKTDVFMIGKNIVDFPDMIKDSALLIIMNQGSLHLNKDIADLIRSFVAKGGG